MKARKRGSNDEWKDVQYVQLQDSYVIQQAKDMEFDAPSMEEKTNVPISDEAHWRDVRERSAIAALQGLSANPQLFYDNSEEKIILTARAIKYANELVEQLKKKRQ